MEEKKYGVIHELGDYSVFKEVSDEDNEQIKQQILREQKESEENQEKK